MADVPATSDSNLPANLPYKTLTTFRETLRADGIPQRVDKSMMRNMSGTVQNQLMHGLRQLRLIDKDGTPLELLERWVNATGPEQKEVLKEILEQAYPTILGQAAGGFNLGATTAGHLREKFDAFGGKTDITRKAQTFFLHAAKDAGLTISSRIAIRHRVSSARTGSGRSPRTSSAKGSKDTSNNGNGKSSEDQVPDKNSNNPPLPSLQEQLQQQMVSKFPDFNPEWSPELLAKWMDGFEKVWNKISGEEQTSKQKEIEP